VHKHTQSHSVSWCLTEVYTVSTLTQLDGNSQSMAYNKTQLWLTITQLSSTESQLTRNTFYAMSYLSHRMQSSSFNT